jgi:hypothetical protein
MGDLFGRETYGKERPDQATYHGSWSTYAYLVSMQVVVSALTS